MEIRLEHRSVHSALKLLYILSKLFGIAPLNLKSEAITPWNFKPAVRLRWEIFRTLYPLTILLILMTVNCISLRLKIQTVYKPLKYTHVVTDSFRSVLAFATVFVSIFQTITFNRNKLGIIFSKINSSEKSILRNSASDMCRRTSRLFVTNITINATTFGLACACEFISISGLHPIILMTRYCSHIIRIVMDMQFVTFNFLLKYLFVVLNKQLLSVFGIHSEKELEQNLLHSICNAPKELSERSYMPLLSRVNIYRENREMNGNCVWKRSPLAGAECFPNTNSKQETGLQVLRIHHNEICNITRLVVSTYGVYIIFELLNISADIITVLYFITDFLISEGDLNIATTVTYFLWLLLHVSKLISVTRSCQLVSSCGNHTSVLVRKLMLLSRPISSSGMIQLHKFSQQLLNTKLYLSACDFFDLNSTILKSVAKAAISYVIVLLLNQAI
jgi:hypothetical protein